MSEPQVNPENREWAQSSDPLVEFMSACCEKAPRLSVPADCLWHSYRVWSHKACELYPLSRKTFTERMQGAGFKRALIVFGACGRVKCWVGLGLKEAQR